MGLKTQFLQAAYLGNFDIPARFAPPFRDLKSDTYIQPALEEVMLEALDYPDGPQMKDVFAVLINTANTGDQQARKLLERMAQTYAAYYEQERATETDESFYVE